MFMFVLCRQYVCLCLSVKYVIMYAYIVYMYVCLCEVCHIYAYNYSVDVCNYACMYNIMHNIK